MSAKPSLKVAIVFGTRPEAIKLAPVILAFKADPAFDCRVCVTGQHRQMLDQVLEVFGIEPDSDLNLMQPNQTLGGLTSRAIAAIDGYLDEEKPDLVLVQGDTTTVFCSALAAFYHKIPVGHVEAGLRTGSLQSPWPEEANRVLTTRLATLHFAPTDTNRQNLLKEGVPDRNIFVTGNTVIDALFLALEMVRKSPPHIPGLPESLQPSSANAQPATLNPQLVLITGHRRENFGEGFENICNAIATLAKTFPHTHFVYPVHLNPRVREPVNRILKKEGSNVHLIEPLSYLPFVYLMSHSVLVLTDSGGVQEEAPSLRKPVLVMRETTERTEAISAGTVMLVGTDPQRITDRVAGILKKSSEFSQIARTVNPYGDGDAADRIREVCLRIQAHVPGSS